MALGIQTESAGGNFTPVVKINAKQGRVYRVDRTETDGSWTTEDVEITRDFAFVPDFENIEVGWMHFAAGMAPDLQMVPLGVALPARPTENHKQGLRLRIKLGKTCGGDLRELAATAKSITAPMDRLHDAWLAGRAKNPGKAPQVKMVDMKKIDTKTQHGTNTNFEPVFEITGWVDREKAFAAAEPTLPGPPAPRPVAETEDEF